MKADGVGHDQLRAAHLQPVDDVGEAVTCARARGRRRHVVCITPGSKDDSIRCDFG